MSELPTGTITLLFTDIEGSTRLLGQLGEHYADVLTECRQLLRAVFQQWNGHEVDTQGDSFFVVFTRATDAVSAALAMQHALAGYPWPNGVTVRARIGLHTGEPQLASEGYVGLDVHHAARIMSIGHGGQVLLSQTTRELVKQNLPDGVSLRDLGEHRRTYNILAVSFNSSLQACLPISHPLRPSATILTTCPFSPPRSSDESSKWLPSSTSSLVKRCV